jgi:hypothetical protein
MKKATLLLLLPVLFILSLSCSRTATENQAEEEWISLFDGQTLDGWKASENPGTFRVEDGLIVVDGPRAHLFYVGPVMNHDFKNFEFKAEIMTKPGANSGMYFHTEYQEDGWPAKGYEVQVNNSHSDWRRTGSLYAVQDVRDVLVNDNEWFTQHIIVEGNQITVRVNDQEVVSYTEPENAEGAENGRSLSSGTFALQGHDPESVIYYRQVLVKPLPE